MNGRWQTQKSAGIIAPTRHRIVPFHSVLPFMRMKQWIDGAVMLQSYGVATIRAVTWDEVDVCAAKRYDGIARCLKK